MQIKALHKHGMVKVDAGTQRRADRENQFQSR